MVSWCHRRSLIFPKAQPPLSLPPLTPFFNSFTPSFGSCHHRVYATTNVIIIMSSSISSYWSCLLPPFNCNPDTFNFRYAATLSPPLPSKSRDISCSQPQCVLSTPHTVLALEKLAFSSSSATLPPCSHDPWPYLPPSSQLSTESLVTTKEEDAAIAAAASQALALAKSALQLAKDAALLAPPNNQPPPPPPHPLSSTFHDNLILLKWVQHLEAQEHPAGPAPHLLMEHHVYNNTTTKEAEESHDDDAEEPTHDELERLQQQLSDSIAVRSTRQTERKARRVRATEKAATNMVSFKPGSTGSRKKRVPTQEVDYSDPLRYLRATTSASRLLTATEEIELSQGIQDLLKLEKLQEDLAERCGGQPTFAQWAAVAGVDQKTLRKRLNYGMFCKDKMIKSNIRLVISIAKNYQGAGMNLQDLVQEGCRGLVRGAEKFDASKGFKFSTYAHWWIKQAVRKSLSDQSRTIRLPFHMVEATYRVKEARKQLYSENGRQPDDEEVAEATGLSMKRLSAVLLTPKAPRSLEQKIGINQNLKPSEVIADPEAETAEELLIKQFMKKDLEKVLDSLNPREKQVIRWRFGMDDGRMKTLQEIGESMGVSRERVRQIEACAFRKLKNKKKTKNLQQYLVS
ncbi:hypothetical protein RIF29_05344 [Crotalaria pallida]|uniref:RNA polymerase sigma-70 domain-containing protein n=1 Tax=Crotalaria pallida TaxID=3830 RepID=A0AAN9J1Z1_CROPI